MISDYIYPGARQSSGRRRPVGRGDFYGDSYDDAYPDYVQPYEYDDIRGMLPSQLPYEDRGSDETQDFSIGDGHPKSNSVTTAVSTDSGSG